MSFAQQKQRQYVQLSQTIQHLANELNVSRDLLNETSRQIAAMGKFGALHAAQMMAVETVETYIEEKGRLPYATSDTTQDDRKTTSNIQTETETEGIDSGNVDMAPPSN